MKNIIYLSLVLILISSCNNPKVNTSTNIQLPLIINQKRESVPEDNIQLDSQLFISDSDKFREIDINALFNKGHFIFKDSIKVLLVSDSPTQNYRGDLYFVSLSKHETPIDLLKVLNLGEISKTIVIEDTISIYTDYEYSGWLKKYTTNKEGHFILLSEEKAWETDYDPN